MNTGLAAARQLGTDGPALFPLGLGCMGMSGMYGQHEEAESIRTIHAAINAGVTLFDTGDFYGMGHNEMLLGRAIRESGVPRDRLVISSKFGALRGPDGGWLGFDCSKNAAKNALACSLTRLGLEYLDIYRPARLDARVPIEDTVGSLKDTVKTGYLRAIGLSEMGPETIRKAHAVHPIRDLQIEYAVVTRSTAEGKVFPVLTELGIGVTAYGVLSRGLLAGSKVAQTQADYRSHLPRFLPANQEKNESVVATFAGLAREKDCTASQLAIAWVLAKQPAATGVVPLLGARTVAQLNEALGALEVQLTPEDVARIEQAVPADALAGSRYDALGMRMLDSEK